MATKTPQAAPGLALDRLPPAGKVGVGALFVVLIAALYFVVFYGDVESDRANAQHNESGLRQKLTEAERSREEYQRDAEEKTRREQKLREYKKILPDDPEMPTFLSTIQDVATMSGVNLTSWSPTEEITDEFYAKLPMKLTLAGKYHQVAKFFHGVGQQDRIINIEDIRIKKSRADADDVDVQCVATAFRAARAGETAKRRGGQR
jgi:type IV pilus assembly protein PilO